jgi:GxxExxY protein
MHTDKLKYKELTLELKAGRCLEPVYEAQLLNYLKATTIDVELLMNFGNEPTFNRLVYYKQQQQSV